LKSVLALLVAAAIIAAASLASAKTDFSGKWLVSGSINGDNAVETISPTCTIKQSDGELSGSCKGVSGIGSIDGAADGDTIAWTWKRIATNDKVLDATITFRGTLGSDGVIRGQWKDSNIDDEVGTFVAQRMKS
jgi:hypothetical protein